MINPYKFDDYETVISFSGGRTSGYMLKKILDAYENNIVKFEINISFWMENFEQIFIPTLIGSIPLSIFAWIEYLPSVNR